ncbi:DNA-directed RNA polymerase [Candidatus Micrarchaeota archaeon]|nr:DNA-directed RNA polymerase [Candidatus Micrarchaeota archaeon]
MYYLVNVEDKACIPANLLSMDITEATKKVLRESYERRILKNLGLILSIDDVEIVGKGIVVPGDSNVYYTTKFNALVFNASVNEVFESEVKEIVEFGAFAGIGPLDGLLHLSQIGGEKFFYDKKNKNLSSRGKRAIKKGDIIYVKVSTISMKSSVNDTKVGLTMRAEGLGKDEWIASEKKVQKKDKPAKKGE